MNINNLNYRPPMSYSEPNKEQEKVMNGEVCNDGRNEIIERAKQDLLESTNIDTSPDEMKVLNDFLFRCWQMGWLEKYVESEE